MNEQQYIEHEVQIRVLKGMQDAKFLEFKTRFEMMQHNSDVKFQDIKNELLKIENRLSVHLGILITGIVVPIFLKIMGIF